MKIFRNIMIIAVILVAVIMITVGVYYNVSVGPVNKNDNSIKIVEIKQGSTSKSIAKTLKDEKLIRSEIVFRFYLKLKKINNLQAATYELSPNMSVETIVNKISKGDNYVDKSKQVTITFKEGLSMRQAATLISEKTNNSYDDVLNLMKDEEYISSLIKDYWFLTGDIKNDKLYYPLEGYLFPDTYIFESKEVDVKTIFKKMLDRMDQVLSVYKEKIQSGDNTPHKVLTLASIIEKEGKTNDFANISSVFHNRMKKGQKLGSCATAYYGMGLEFNELGIATSEVINAKNDYNTYLISALPVGPISLPSKNSIEAAINPSNTEYLYFLSDNEGVTYFFKTYTEHQNKQKELQKLGKWDR